MFSCFGLRSRQKTLNSSVLSDCGELRVPLTPRDGVPLNFHNHHNKYALFQYYNTLQRPSFYSSRRNSQTSCGSGDSTSKTAKSDELRPKSENFSSSPNDAVPDGLKITDIDNNTTDIIKCNGDFVTISNGADFIRKYGKHKKSKKQSQTLPKNISIENFEGLKIGNGNWKNKKNVRLSELFSNADVQKAPSFTKANSSNHLETEISKNSFSDLLKLSSDKKSSKSEKSLAKALKKELKKQSAQNRGLSPTDLDSYATQKPDAVRFAAGHVSSASISDSKINSSGQNETISSQDKTKPQDCATKAAVSEVVISPGCADDREDRLLSQEKEAPVLLTAQKTRDDAVTSKKSESELLKSSPKKPATPLNDTPKAALTESKIPLLPQSKNGLIKVGVRNDAASLLPNGREKIEISPISLESRSLDAAVCDTESQSCLDALRKPQQPSDVSDVSTSVVSPKFTQGDDPKHKLDSANSARPTPNGKIIISKLPYRRTIPRPYESLSPVSYSRLPISSDKQTSAIFNRVASPTEKYNTGCSSEKPGTKVPCKTNFADENSTAVQKNGENFSNRVVIQVSATKIESKDNQDSEKKALCLMDIDDSSIPLIDTDEVIITTPATERVSEKLNEKPPKQLSKIPSRHSTSANSSDTALSKSVKPLSAPSIAVAAPPFRIFPDARKRKQDDVESAVDQPVKTARSTKSASAVASDTAELKRLEAALSAKSSEVEEAKREAQEARNEACEAGKGLQALTVLVHHLTKQYEAFSNPLLKTEIARLQKCLQEAEHALGESRNALEAAETRLSEEQASAALQQQQLSEEHESAVQQLRQQHEQQLQQLTEQQQLQLEELNKKHEGDAEADREKHEQEVQRLLEEHEQKITSLVRDHQEKLQALSDDVERLKKLQQNGVYHDVSSQVSELTAAQAEREQELQAQSLNLQKEGEKLKERNKKLHESLLSDTDHRLVGIRQHCSDLQKEVDSLKSVVEMRNCELHKLRAQVLTMEQLERDLEAARHLAKTLQAKTEDLNAQMNTKAQTERQLMQSNLQLKETMDRESSANKQLRLENEQLQWKLRQREQLSHSLPPSSLDGMSRISHLNTSWQDRPSSLHHQHVFREEQQPSLSRSGSIREERGPLTSSPVHTTFACKRDSTKSSPKDFNDEHSRMRGTFDGLSPPSSPCVKAVVEKSNSVSFVLDLNDSLSDDSYLDFPASPRIKHATPVLGRKGLQKSRSSSLEKKPGAKVGRSNSLSKCTSAGNFFSKLHAKEMKPKTQKLSTDSDGDQHMQSDGSAVREHTTSESSCGAESVERVSPHGMSWTVPVDDCSPNSPRSPKLDSSRGCFSSLRHLHQPEEDEYEENLEENDGFIAGIPSDLTPLVNLMNESSSSPSDSELSHCGSQAGLTSESEEESSLAESCDRVGDSLSPVAEWVSTVGAGEAMVPSELVSNCCESESTDSSDQIVTKDSIPTHVLTNKHDSTRTAPKDSISNCTVATASANQQSLRQN